MASARSQHRPPLPPVPNGLRDAARRPSPAPYVNVAAPMPSRAPSHIPAAQLEDQASEIGIPGAYPGSGRSTPASSYRAQPHPRAASAIALGAGMSSLSIEDAHRRASGGSYPQQSPILGRSPPQRFQSDFRAPSPSPHEAPLALPPRTFDDLEQQRSHAGQDIVALVRWARDLLRYVERTVTGTSINEPMLVQRIDEAVKHVLHGSSTMPPIPEALFLRAELGMSGSFPSLVPRNPKLAFRDFESAANAEYGAAWYRIGREYESFQDFARSLSAYESGFRLGDVTCTYRLAMAHLLGQLGVPIDIRRAIDLLCKSATIADRFSEPEYAAPLFVWAMVLAGEFEAPGVDPSMLPSDPIEAGRWMGKAAYLGHALAQHKMGTAHEFGQLGEPFDPLRSVQWYSLASQQGDREADLALSKWFLCGAPDYFDRNETLAFTFAEKAASAGLPAGVFAVAYYYESGIGVPRDEALAKQHYRRALQLGNEDARARLQALEAAVPMTRAQADREINRHLTQRRTQARIASESVGRPPQHRLQHPRAASSSVLESSPAPPVEIRRRDTLRMAETTAQTGWDRPRPAKTNGSAAEPKRYTLSDTPATPPSQPSRTFTNDSPIASPASASSRLPPVRTESPAVVEPQRKGPATFEEMGIAQAKLKKEECTIM